MLLCLCVYVCSYKYGIVGGRNKVLEHPMNSQSTKKTRPHTRDRTQHTEPKEESAGAHRGSSPRPGEARWGTWDKKPPNPKAKSPPRWHSPLTPGRTILPVLEVAGGHSTQPPPTDGTGPLGERKERTTRPSQTPNPHGSRWSAQHPRSQSEASQAPRKHLPSWKMFSLVVMCVGTLPALRPGFGMRVEFLKSGIFDVLLHFPSCVCRVWFYPLRKKKNIICYIFLCFSHQVPVKFKCLVLICS